MEWHSFAEKFHRIPEGSEWEEFKKDIALTEGNTRPIEYRMVGAKRQGLDGRNRLLACEELGLEPSFKEIKIKDEDCISYIVRANILRRHLDAASRKDLVALLRADGKSTREIAGTLNVPKSTVHRDIKDNEDGKEVSGETETGVPNGTPSSPTKNTAKSAKKKGKTKKAPVNKSDGEADGAHQTPTDSVDQPIPPGLTTLFEKAEEFKEIVNQLNAIGRKLKELKDHPAGAGMTLQGMELDLRNLKEAVRFSMPYAVCPACKGIAKMRKGNCPCKQRGWLVETSYKNLPQEYRP